MGRSDHRHPNRQKPDYYFLLGEGGGGVFSGAGGGGGATWFWVGIYDPRVSLIGFGGGGGLSFAGVVIRCLVLVADSEVVEAVE